MITDKIENVDLYNQIPKLAKDFIKNIKPDIETGKYVLSENIYANVEIYNTKSVEDAKYEAHERYIDIQLLLKGYERIYYRNKRNLNEKIPYNNEKDIIFYQNKIEGDFVTLDCKNFAMLFTHEAHAPQICIQNAQEVKKVVVKIKTL